MEVEKGRADFGVVPIENSTGGGVYHSVHEAATMPLPDAEVVTFQ